MAATTRTPLSPPRYPTPLRPRYNTNPSSGNGTPYARTRTGSSDGNRRVPSDRFATGGTGHASGQITDVDEGVKPLPPIPPRPQATQPLHAGSSSAAAPMSVDEPPTSSAIPTNAIFEFPLPPQRELPPPPAPPAETQLPTPGSSSSSHGMSTRSQPRVRPLPARPGPPRPELVPAWEPDVKKHIPDEATLDSRIASYAKLSEPPPKLRDRVRAREQGVTMELESAGIVPQERVRTGAPNAASSSRTAPTDRERLGRLRKPAVNGLVRVEKGQGRTATTASLGLPPPTTTSRKGKMREHAMGLVSDMSGIAGEWTLDPALPRLGSTSISNTRPSLGSMVGASSSRTASATGSRNSLLPSDQGHSTFSATTTTGSSMDVRDDPSASLWRKRKRVNPDLGTGGGRQTLPTAVFETDKGNIDVRLAIVDQGSSATSPVPHTDPVTERYMGTSQATARKGLLNAKSRDGGALPFGNGPDPTGMDSCARVEVLSRKGNVRVEIAELQGNRQVALQVTSRDGNIFLSIPERFVGPIQCSTAANQSVMLLPSLKARAQTIYDDRGESLYYLGQRPISKGGNSHPPILPPRRLSNRLRKLSQGNGTPAQEYAAGRSSRDSPTAMDVDQPISLPNASKITNSSAQDLIPQSRISSSFEAARPTQVKESSVYASSYTGSICIGLHGLEPKHVFKGATTLTGLLDGLGEAKKLLKDKINTQALGSRHFV